MRSPRPDQWYALALVGIDAALLLLAFVISSALSSVSHPELLQAEVGTEQYTLIALAMISGLLVTLWLRQAYDRHHLLGGPDEYARVVSGCTYGTVLATTVSFVRAPLPPLSAAWLLTFWALSIMLLGAGRFTSRRVAYSLRRRGWFIRRVLILGSNDQGLAIAQQLHGSVEHGVHIVGFLDDYLHAGTRVAVTATNRRGAASNEFLILGQPREAAYLAAQFRCDLLIVVTAALSWESQQQLARLSGSDTAFEVRLAPTQYELTTAAVEAAPLEHIPLLRLQRARIVGMEAVVRAGIDFVLAGLLLVLAAPALVWLVVLARLRGIRPILTRRQVLGQGNRRVTLSVLHPSVTRQLLLRGVPALLAVLRGDLALVGPRPVRIDEQSLYEDWTALLMSVKPGLIGPWRLTDYRATPEEKVLADVLWVRNWTVWQHLFVLYQVLTRLLHARRARRQLVRWEVERAEMNDVVAVGQVGQSTADARNLAHVDRPVGLMG
jgi:lipopolysaccharide/colanic/teichoic acid biosynthesis glycosyltransferase